jgi:beta-galactosidase
MVVNGEEQLAEPVRLSVWRAPTDNDKNIKVFWGSYNIWQGENFDKIFSKVYNCTVTDGCICVDASLAGVSRKPFFRYTLQVKVNCCGVISASLNGTVREKVVYLPRLGFEFTLPKKNMKFRYYGCGPMESYSDLRHGSTVGMYESTAEAEYVPYVRPQEHGNHVDVRMLSIGKLLFESDNTFSCNVSAFSTEAIDQAEHTDELHSDDKTHLRIDYKVSGIGSASCGPELMEKYRLSERNITFGFTISPTE